MNTLTFPCPLCKATITVAIDDINVKVTPPDRGRGLKRSAIVATAIGATNHVHGKETL